MFCGWIRVHRSNADSLGAAAVDGEGTAERSDRSSSGDGDPKGKAGLSTGPAGSRA